MLTEFSLNIPCKSIIKKCQKCQLYMCWMRTRVRKVSILVNWIDTISNLDNRVELPNCVTPYYYIWKDGRRIGIRFGTALLILSHYQAWRSARNSACSSAASAVPDRCAARRSLSNTTWGSAEPSWSRSTGWGEEDWGGDHGKTSISHCFVNCVMY